MLRDNHYVSMVNILTVIIKLNDKIRMLYD